MGLYDTECKELANTLLRGETRRTDKVISKSGFDKTYIGKVIDIYPSAQDTVNDKKQTGWLVFANASTYIVPLERCNITAVGEEVRIYFPNNDRSEVYAETINASEKPHPSKITFNWNTDTYTNHYDLPDGTILEEKYVLTVKDKGKTTEEVTAITFPDGSVMSLEGFIIGQT